MPPPFLCRKQVVQAHSSVLRASPKTPAWGTQQKLTMESKSGEGQAVFLRDPKEKGLPVSWTFYNPM